MLLVPSEQSRKINRVVKMIYVCRYPDDRDLTRDRRSSYGIDDFDILHLTDGSAFKDNDRCGCYYVNDLADVSKMRLRVAGCSARIDSS